MAEGGSNSLNTLLNDLIASQITGEAGFFPDFSLENQSLGTGLGDTGNIYLEILEQPRQRGFRFRYPCEGPSHGGLPGEKSKKGNKTYPSVQIVNYVGPARIEVTLVTISDPPQPHAHSLVGKGVREGSYVVEVGPEQHMTAAFPNVGIQHVTKKKVKDVLMERHMKTEQLKRAAAMSNVENEQSSSNGDDVVMKDVAQEISEEEKRNIEQIIDEQVKNMNLSAVKLCFRTFLPDDHGQFVRCLNPVYSQEIFDSKAAAASELRICRIDRQAGTVTGGDEVFLLCEKVQKDDVEIRFFETRNGREWEAFGHFSTSDVHRQFAIVFKTPQYWDTAIERPVTVQLELRRKSDREKSNTIEFTYKPSEFDPEQIGAKRRKKVPHFSEYSNQSSSTSGFPVAPSLGPGIGPGSLPPYTSFPQLDPSQISQFFTSMYQTPGLSMGGPQLPTGGDLPSSGDLSGIGAGPSGLSGGLSDGGAAGGASRIN